MNQWNATGNLTRDIELRYTSSGMAIAKTAIASTRKYTSNGEKKEEVLFIDLTFFGRSAEVANQYLNKGSKILVTGRIIFDTWVDSNGAKQSKHSVVVENMEMLDSRTKAPNQLDNNQPPQQQQEAQQPTNYEKQQKHQQQSPQQPAAQKQHAALPIEDEDEIPF